MIIEELEAIRSAAQALAVRDATSTDRLLEASAQLWSSMYERAAWPSRAEPSAQQILDKVTANGTVEATLPEMDEETAQNLAEDIVQLANVLEGENHVRV